MSYVPDNLKYTESHEWIEILDNGNIRVGITEHAQSALGDIVFVELPEEESYAAGDDCGVVESVKTASDIYAPISGTIVAVNDALEDSPELINESPYDDGWIFEMEIEDEDDLEDLLSSDEYKNSIEEDQDEDEDE
ncbi:MAG TPA: glycine cleavage system protein GcvH [Gammaproteobacteria bacterium]|nr:glycine cleavage system protein GcvH [Xanthomonadales bacterium]MCB1594381.1 glycine cleavage system protein GcvH [Xanthomonadales bacterium]HPI95294.1 glycine cleavage system protein GcvH [Gammaproteobacteria bacterium]HPQ87268.1 glycine cleavage system protein GcvH [Gammaproteobacteria bacterium]